MLEKDGRKSFNNIDAGTFALVDKQKCHHEIPLVDIRTNQVWYGIDALLELLSTKPPGIKFLGNIKPVKWLLQKLYSFISFNLHKTTLTGQNPAKKNNCAKNPANIRSSHKNTLTLAR